MEDDFNDFSELSAGETSIGIRRCLKQVSAERDQLRAELAAAKEELENAKLNWRLSQKRATEHAKEATALAADNERLRKALECIPVDLANAIEDGAAPVKLFLSLGTCKLIGDALAATPAQSLAALKAAALEAVKARLYALASKEADQPYGHDMNPRQWAATCLECAAEDVTAMQEELLAEADRIEKEAENG